MYQNRKQDEIRIENLEVYAYHGVFPEENEKGQPFFVNAVLYTDTRKAGQKDDLHFSTHYGEVCHLITKRMQEHTYQLIETVAETVAREILLNFQLITAVDLEIRKPEAPIGLPFQSVSVKIYRGWHRVYLAVGSNLGDREKYIRDGIKELEKNQAVRILKASELLSTKPYGGVEQEDFLNGALEIETLLMPSEFLEELHRIEALADRKRLVHWGPRTLDLDIIFYDDWVYADKNLMIPHVDMQNRTFVLEPLCQIAPYMVHPILHKTVRQLLEELRRAEQVFADELSAEPGEKSCQDTGGQ